MGSLRESLRTSIGTSLAALNSLRTSGPVDPEAMRQARMAVVRATGAQGGRIDPHRSIATIDLRTIDMALAAALAVAVTLTYLLAFPLLGRAWTALFAALAGPLGLGGVAERGATIAGVVRVSVPYFTGGASEPTRMAWWVALVVTAVLVALTVPMRARWLPMAYAVRFAAAIQCTALVFFAGAPGRFPYDLAAYVSGMMLVGATLIGIVPIVFGLTFFLVDVSWSRKLALTLLVMGHLAVLVPLQYALQAALVAHASLIVLPVCFIMFGLLPEIMVLVALFGWGMSWPSGRARGRRQ